PSTALHQRPNTYSIKHLMRLVDEPKSCAISAQFISFEVLMFCLVTKNATDPVSGKPGTGHGIFPLI
ncbi:MAG: hypothetical protein PF503_16505, partial [Desulfobacula sp.]|nr:hypothetical protein [Desulfobacula sp.]